MKKQINEIKKMQLLAGLITESEYREAMIQDSSDLKVKWTPEYYSAIKKYGDEAYDEKGLADGFTMKNGKKVKEIVGYYVPEGSDNSSNEEFDVIGYIYSTSGKDIETEYSEDDLDNAFNSVFIKENLENDDIIYDTLVDMDHEQLVSNMLSTAENNPSLTLIDYLKKYNTSEEM